MTQRTPHQITAPDEVVTPAGTFEFFDGVPTKATARAVYDYVDRARGVQVFIDMMPSVNMLNVRKGQRALGISDYHQIYPDTGSEWLMADADNETEFLKDGARRGTP